MNIFELIVSASSVICTIISTVFTVRTFYSTNNADKISNKQSNIFGGNKIYIKQEQNTYINNKYINYNKSSKDNKFDISSEEFFALCVIVFIVLLALTPILIEYLWVSQLVISIITIIILIMFIKNSKLVLPEKKTYKKILLMLMPLFVILIFYLNNSFNSINSMMLKINAANLSNLTYIGNFLATNFDSIIIIIACIINVAANYFSFSIIFIVYISVIFLPIIKNNRIRTWIDKCLCLWIFPLIISGASFIICVGINFFNF